MHAGNETPASKPSLPEATNTATPAATSDDTALVVLLPVHGNADGLAYWTPSPRLMLTTRIPSATRLASAQLSAASMSENRPPELLEPNTRIAAIPASGAIPGAATTPPDVMIP